MGHRTRAHVAVLPASVVLVAVMAALFGIQACSNTSAPAAQPCDQTCMDQTAVRSLREGLKLIFNDTLQGRDVGVQDSGTVPCPLGGTAHVFGTATSNAAQGSTMVNLTYVLDHCVNQQTDSDPTQTYNLTFTGTITEVGIIAVQPSSTTSLALASDSDKPPQGRASKRSRRSATT